jgi:nitroreductase
MNIFEAMTTRRSVRKFQKADIDDKMIGVMLYMATQAPSAGNTQEWKFIVVRDKKQKEKLAKAALNQSFVKDAPVVIVVFADLNKISMRFGARGENFYAFLDTGAAIQNVLLSATALGLASCWVSSFDDEIVKTVLEVPETYRPIAIIPVGYAAEAPEAPKRTHFESYTWSEKYGHKYELTVATQPGREQERLIGPLGNCLEEEFEKLREKWAQSASKPKETKKSLREFLKKLAE